MVCNCCTIVISQEFTKIGISVISMELGKATIKYNSLKIDSLVIKKTLLKNGFDLISDREKVLLEQIKSTIIELIHYSNNVNSIIRKSDYLIEKMNMSYQNISKIFSKHEKITLEKFIILNKIERCKELVLQNEFTLSEIAYMMDFSSVQHLSNTFRKHTGITVTDYKKDGKHLKKPLDKLY